MATNWFYWSDGERVGPVSGAELKRLAASGVVSPSTTVEDETGKTALAERVAGLLVAPSPFALDAKIDRLGATASSSLETLEKRFAELSERLERVETRNVDAENAERAKEAASNAAESAAFETFEKRLGEWDAALTAIVEKIDALTERVDKVAARDGERSANAIEEKSRVLSERLDAVERLLLELPPKPASLFVGFQEGGKDAFELPAGSFNVGVDLPPGRYRAEIQQEQGARLVLKNAENERVGSWVLWSKYPSAVVEMKFGYRFEQTKALKWTRWSIPIGGAREDVAEEKSFALENKNGDESVADASPSRYSLPSGKHYVGIDIPPGRYRAEIRRGYEVVTAVGRDGKQSYFLNTDADSDTYNPSCVLELRSGAKLTFNRPTDFIYLGALR